nr:MAG TPA: hypothetical protein [Caudoviricetes sp.]
MLYLFKIYPLFAPFYALFNYFSVQLLCNLFVII